MQKTTRADGALTKDMTMAKDTKVDEKDAIELSRPLKMDGVPRAGIDERIVAKPVEREALAKRLKIASLDRFEANITVEHEHGNMFTVKGGIFAELTQLCVVTTEPVKETVRDDFDLLMAPDYVLAKMQKKKGGETADVEQAESISSRYFGLR